MKDKVKEEKKVARDSMIQTVEVDNGQKQKFLELEKTVKTLQEELSKMRQDLKKTQTEKQDLNKQKKNLEI